MKIRIDEGYVRVLVMKDGERKACKDCFKSDVTLYLCEVDKKLRCLDHVKKHEVLYKGFEENTTRSHQDTLINKYEVE